MKIKKKVNPRRIPATQADVKRAKTEAVREAVAYTLAIVFTVLLDKENFTQETLQRVWKEVEYLSNSVEVGRISVQDLVDVLRDEYDIILR